MYVKLFARFRKNNPHLSRFGFLLFFAAVVFSCSKEESALSSPESDMELKIAANINVQVRATDAGFEEGDTIGLYVTKWQDAIQAGVLQNTGNYADNILFHLPSLPNDWLSDNVIYYPGDDDMLDIYAYYPYRSPAFGTECIIDLTVAANQTKYADYTHSDFMVAKVQGLKRSPDPVQLTFNHMLSQMVFALKAGAGFTLNDLRAAKVRVMNAVTDGRYDLAGTLAPVAGSVRHDLTPCGSWEEGSGKLTGKKAIVIPQSISSSTYVEVSLGDRKFNFKPSDAIILSSGCSRTFTITVNNTGLDITTAINLWDNCPPVSGEAGEDFGGEVWDGTIASGFGGGNGSAEQPYLISKGSHLAKLADDVNSGKTKYADNYFNLTNDLDMGNKLFPAIGVQRERSFAGHFDGNCHVIRNLNVNEPGKRAGLFACLRYDNIGNQSLSVVKNLGVEGSISGDVVGGIVGEVTFGALRNCYFKGNLASTGFLGGLCGYCSYPVAVISDCYAAIENATMVNSVGSSFGGVIGTIYNAGGSYSNNYAVIHEFVGIPEYKGGSIGSIIRRETLIPVRFESVPQNLYATSMTNSIDMAVGGASNVEDIPSNAFFLISNDEMRSVQILNALGAAFKPDAEGINDGFPLLSWQ